MAKYELQVNIPTGVLVVHFDSMTELEQRLKEFSPETLDHVIRDHFKSAVRVEPRAVKPALERICVFRGDGTLEFLKPAGSKLETIGLILYAYDPDPVELETIGLLSAAENPAAYLGQKAYVKLFQKIGKGRYGLSHEGKVWVASTVIPKTDKES